MKRTLLSIALLSLPAIAGAADSVGGCGLGSKLFDGQKGMAPQVLAVTTNGTSGNQTFGITSGTLGCSQNGVVKSNWRMAMFLDQNLPRLAADMSRGSGEALDALASLVGVSSQDNALFRSALKTNFASVFTGAGVSSSEVRINLARVIAADPSLAKYSAQI